MNHRLVLAWRGPVALAVVAATSACEVLNIGGPGMGLSTQYPDSTTTLVRQSNTGLFSPERLVISDADTWGANWDRIHGNRQPSPALPIVDFGVDAVVLAALGLRPTGGFGIRVDSVVTYSATVRVYVTTTSAGPSCILTQAVTAPVHAVRIPRPSSPVSFRERSTQHDCLLPVQARGLTQRLQLAGV